MLIRHDVDSLLLITQMDHARVAGELAEAWGAAPWARPEPYESVCLAAALHDEGWAAADARPALDPETGWPTPFWALPYRERAAFYQEGITEVAAQNAYAGLLVSLHLVALWDGGGIRAPLDLTSLPEEEAAAVAGFISREASRQTALRQHLAAAAPAGEAAFHRALQVNLHWLAIWDWLSLLLCLDADVNAALDGPAATPGPSLSGVPLGYVGAGLTDLQVRRLEPGVLGVDPYPFIREPLSLMVPARRLPARRYGSDGELLAAYRGAPVEYLHFAIMALR